MGGNDKTCKQCFENCYCFYSSFKSVWVDFAKDEQNARKYQQSTRHRKKHDAGFSRVLSCQIRNRYKSSEHKFNLCYYFGSSLDVRITDFGNLLNCAYNNCNSSRHSKKHYSCLCGVLSSKLRYCDKSGEQTSDQNNRSCSFDNFFLVKLGSNLYYTNHCKECSRHKQQHSSCLRCILTGKLRNNN